ncbi:MAG: hypothetical protein ACTHOJ_00970 [Sphingomonas oligoaromativorans]
MGGCIGTSALAQDQWANAHGEIKGSPDAEPTRHETIEINARIRRLSTLLTVLAGTNNELRLDMCDGCRELHSRPRLLELVIVEAVSQLRHRLAGPGVITVRTRALRHHALIIVAAHEFGDAVFRFGARRTSTPLATDRMFGSAHRLAQECHGVLRRRGGEILILRLPTVLTLVSKRPTFAAPFPPHMLKEKSDDERHSVAA